MRLLVALAIALACCSSNRGPMNARADLALPAGLTLEPTPAQSGTLILWGYQFPGPMYHTSMLARFDTSDGKPGPCSVETIDPCHLEICPVPDGGGPLAPAVTHVGAGSVTYTGPGATSFMLTDSGNDSIFTGDIDMSWMGGEALTMHATGATVPAFTIMTTAPPRTIMLTPAQLSGGLSIPVVRSAGFPITWQPVTNATLQLLLSAPGVTVTCSARADAGILTVPPAVLQPLPSSLAATAATMSFGNAMAGLWPVQLTAQSPALVQAGGLQWGVALALQ